MSTHFDSVFTRKILHQQTTVQGIKVEVAIWPAFCGGGNSPLIGMPAQDLN